MNTQHHKCPFVISCSEAYSKGESSYCETEPYLCVHFRQLADINHPQVATTTTEDGQLEHIFM